MVIRRALKKGTASASPMRSNASETSLSLSPSFVCRYDTRFAIGCARTCSFERKSSAGWSSWSCALPKACSTSLSEILSCFFR